MVARMLAPMLKIQHTSIDIINESQRGRAQSVAFLGVQPTRWAALLPTVQRKCTVPEHGRSTHSGQENWNMDLKWYRLPRMSVP